MLKNDSSQDAMGIGDTTRAGYANTSLRNTKASKLPIIDYRLRFEPLSDCSAFLFLFLFLFLTLASV